MHSPSWIRVLANSPVPMSITTGVLFSCYESLMRNEKHKHGKGEGFPRRTFSKYLSPHPRLLPCSFFFFFSSLFISTAGKILKYHSDGDAAGFLMKISTRSFGATNKSTTAEISGHDSMFLTRFDRKWLIDELFPHFAWTVLSWLPANSGWYCDAVSVVYYWIVD